MIRRQNAVAVRFSARSPRRVRGGCPGGREESEAIRAVDRAQETTAISGQRPQRIPSANAQGPQGKLPRVCRLLTYLIQNYIPRYPDSPVLSPISIGTPGSFLCSSYSLILPFSRLLLGLDGNGIGSDLRSCQGLPRPQHFEQSALLRSRSVFYFAVRRRLLRLQRRSGSLWPVLR